MSKNEIDLPEIGSLQGELNKCIRTALGSFHKVFSKTSKVKDLHMNIIRETITGIKRDQLYHLWRNLCTFWTSLLLLRSWLVSPGSLWTQACPLWSSCQPQCSDPVWPRLYQWYCSRLTWLLRPRQCPLLQSVHSKGPRLRLLSRWSETRSGLGPDDTKANKSFIYLNGLVKPSITATDKGSITVQDLSKHGLFAQISVGQVLLGLVQTDNH